MTSLIQSKFNLSLQKPHEATLIKPSIERWVRFETTQYTFHRFRGRSKQQITEFNQRITRIYVAVWRIEDFTARNDVYVH
ncbi:hypothetical protein J6590_001978, partial [Homalodisca vitripennis]